MVRTAGGEDRRVSSAHPPPDLGYRPALDGLRAVAVVLVLAHHVTELLVAEWSGRWVPGGFLGVDVFFVLSGFLITTLLLEEHQREGRVSLRSFYARRALRLLPAVGVLLLVHALVAAMAGADLGLEARTAAAAALYGVNWVIATGGSLAAGLGHLWSLSVEEQFYLVWPLLLVVAQHRRRPTRLVVAFAVAGISWAIAVRAWLWVEGVGWEAIYVRTDARADELLMGALLAVALRRPWRLPSRTRELGLVSLAVLLLCAVAVRRDESWLYMGGFTLVGAASAVLVASALDTRAPLSRALAVRPLVVLGRASYSLYLWHVPVFLLIAEAFSGRSAAERLVAGLAGCACATAASYRLVEMPVLRLRRSVVTRRTRGDVAPAGRTHPAGIAPS